MLMGITCSPIKAKEDAYASYFSVGGQNVLKVLCEREQKDKEITLVAMIYHFLL